jgi:hypothetical protein
MIVPPHKRLTIALGAGCVATLLLCGWLFWNHSWLAIRVAWASEQARIFDEMRMGALQSDAADAAGCLQYVVGYYPSGTKQETGSRLDRMVEREREAAIRDIVVYLRTRTGEDLGTNPEAWVRKYANR